MLHLSFPQFLTVFSMSLFLVVACSSAPPSTTETLPPPTPTSPIQVAENLAQAFISAVEGKQAADYLALFSYDAVFMDNSNATMREEGDDAYYDSSPFY